MKISDNTSIAMPMRNLISIVVAVAVGVWAYFGIVERINTLETSKQLNYLLRRMWERRNVSQENWVEEISFIRRCKY